MTSAISSLDIAVKSVLLATDFSEVSAKPLTHALGIARHYGANFYLTHVVDSLGYTLAGPPAEELAVEAAQRDAVQLEKQMAADGRLSGLRYEFLVRKGKTCAELERVIEEKRADMVVVGTHGRRPLGKLLLGSVAEQIYRRCDLPVLTVGPGSALDSPLDQARPMETFLYATDFGPASLRALSYAVSFANHFGVRLVLLHVGPVVPMPAGFHWSSTSEDVRQLREDAKQGIYTRLRELLAQAPPLNRNAEFMVQFGMASREILRAANVLRADVIFLGLRRSRHAEMASHLPAATAYEVVCGARCPVLTVRT